MLHNQTNSGVTSYTKNKEIKTNKNNYILASEQNLFVLISERKEEKLISSSLLQQWFQQASLDSSKTSLTATCWITRSLSFYFMRAAKHELQEHHYEPKYPFVDVFASRNLLFRFSHRPPSKQPKANWACDFYQLGSLVFFSWSCNFISLNFSFYKFIHFLILIMIKYFVYF